MILIKRRLDLKCFSPTLYPKTLVQRRRKLEENIETANGWAVCTYFTLTELVAVIPYIEKTQIIYKSQEMLFMYC